MLVQHPTIAIVAGEASGDQLGAHLIAALRRTLGNGARFVGVGGQQMRAQGFAAWHDINELSLMGFAEVLREVPRLLRLRHRLYQRLLATEPDIFIGIDAPDFNLGLERKLKQQAIPTVHYVSPSVWAWRQNRIQQIGRAADKVLCLFPMEAEIYRRHGIDASFVGHPLAHRFTLEPTAPETARKQLGLVPEQPLLAVLPGSRRSEIRRLAPVFLRAAEQVAAQVDGLQIAVAATDDKAEQCLRPLLAQYNGAPMQLFTGQAHTLMLAADIVTLASGTATLEAMLAKRPMVVGYQVSFWSYHAARLLRMLKTDIYALPNILDRADRADAEILAPEYMQTDFTPENLTAAILALLHDNDRQQRIQTRYRQLHQKLLTHGATRTPADSAAHAVLDMLDFKHD